MADEKLHERLRKLLALTESPNEHEAALAATKLQELLLKYNLSMADLEKKGAKPPEVGERPHDLGKAAFKWKLDLAEGIAEHYYCVSLVSRTKKTVSFVGRPENVEALTILYSWVIDQIKVIARDERRKHFDTTGEHIDPLRWQLGFGEGAVSRLVDRLKEMKARQQEDMSRNEFGDVTALAIHHQSETSDYLEKQYGYRVDGRKTKKDEEWEAKWQAYNDRLQKEAEERKALKAECAATGDMAPYYAKYPWELPEAVAAAEKRAGQARKKADRKERRREQIGYYEREDERYERRQAREEGEHVQKKTARKYGEASAARINLQPFIENGRKPVKGEIA